MTHPRPGRPSFIRPPRRHTGARPIARAETVAVAGVLAVLLVITLLDITGHRLFVVGGGSMEPAVPKGSLVIVREAPPTVAAVGDVVTYEHLGRFVTHRIASIEDAAGARVFTTKGDANPVADPDRISFNEQVGLVEAHVPMAGYPLALVQAYGRFAAVFLAMLFLALALLRARSRPSFSPLSA